MKPNDFIIANDILRHLRIGSKGAFALSIRGDAADLSFGANAIPDVQFLLWLKTVDSQYALTNSTSELHKFDFVFDRYGQGETKVRFALVSDGKVLLDSRTTPLAGMFLIRTTPQAEQPACIAGIINHFGETPESVFIANRAPEIIDFSNSLVRSILAMAEGLPLE